MLGEKKGAGLEELVREYFSKQGFYALRGVSLRFEDEEVTDIDVWLYGRQSASVKTRVIVDVKSKKSPKAFERIIWVRGMQLALACDRAIVATTDASPKVTRFAHNQGISLLPKSFIERLEKKIDTTGRLTAEQFASCILSYGAQKQDGDWLRMISDAKSAVISLHGYPAFNKAIAAFRFFSGRAEVRSQHVEQALRGAFLSASLACIALDSALEKVLYEDTPARFTAITNGVTYGDAGDAKVQNSVGTVLNVLENGMQNGRVIARQARGAINKLFDSVRADIIAEHFQKEHNATSLFGVARELEERAHILTWPSDRDLSPEAKIVLGVFADFCQVKRSLLMNSGTAYSEPVSQAAAESLAMTSRTTDLRALVDPKSNEESEKGQSKLL